jgi:UDP-galactopyranose mutase
MGNPNKTVITREYSQTWEIGKERYYPINDAANGELYARYAELANSEPNVIFGGRLGTYRYLDMDQVIAEALELAGRESNEK